MKKDYEKEIENLDDLAYKVTQEDFTERPFDNKYDDNYEKGIYVDVVSKKVLFISTDKFNSGCGWPAFSKPVDKSMVVEKIDKSLGIKRVEVRSSDADSHLGHVFTDGPIDDGGLRYCINSAALLFIPFDKMIELGYEQYINLFNKT